MNIVNANLEFISTPETRDKDFYSLVGTKVVLMSENMSDIDINFLHQVYKEINFTGVPYHYVVMKSGFTYLARPRIYRAGLKYSYQNIFKNAICILIEGMEADALTAAQINSLSELLTMIVLQDNLLVTDIISMKQVYSGFLTSDYRSVLSATASNVSVHDIYRTVGDNDNTTNFSKIVSSDVINSFDTIAKYTRIPKTKLVNMNKHVTPMDGKIPPGMTIFLPDNRMSGYVNDILDFSVINTICTRISCRIQDFKTTLASYGKEVD